MVKTELSNKVFRVHLFIIQVYVSLINLVMSNTRPVFVFHLIEVLVKQIKLVVLIYLQLLFNSSFILWRVLLVNNNY